MAKAREQKILKTVEDSMAMVELSASDMRLWPWKYGVPRDFLERHQGAIENVVKQYDLRPVAQILPVSDRGAKAEMSLDAKEIFDNPWKHGGRKVPHVHYNGEVYLLNTKQWQEFSGAIVQDIHRRLEEAGNIRFNELLEISDAVASLG